MKKHGLRGMPLDVSMALLISGGVALAVGLVVAVDQPCFECFLGFGDPAEDYIVRVIITEVLEGLSL